MKLIGKNSISSVFFWLLFGLFVLCGLHLVYEIVGHLVLLYKYQTGDDVFNQTFILGNEVASTNNILPEHLSEELKFRINYPFLGIQLVTGLYKPLLIFLDCFWLLYITLFFYFAFNSFKEFSSDRVFSSKAVSNLKKLGYLNLIFASIILFPTIWMYQISAFAFLQFFFIAFFGILILFMVAFFKKGLELQSENDLTI
ncbi:MAG: DUF2975 domain-containing protein [Chryseobacterium sp.]|nr:DUF2975 domain-containing protein [Chryseobacterium sp.]